ncbi:FliA/WhiG family RNA polymerase sigma factor [Halanaerobium sp. Z-7514]|uniref:FliA/WhiG family RNA polymerase sigma factor n=1 Tax=Halanaerobium polyolivorans TaxID=2886943 RepID=A0AAW4WZ93_9FIRM|nr:FliA/WhiG family RNA polymerase sigma factor [Halanaerobium polyolivorans]MCC3145184.1 FliA/WhiG family RNA polymerase sigma factor [Halanaerobium polyolivorans]
MAIEREKWHKFKEQNDASAREELILKHLNLVRYAVGRIMIMLPDHIRSEDLESYGIIGLIEAIDNFDPKRGLQFSTFALPRIKGEIYDYLRDKDWLPSNMRRELKILKEKKEEFKAEKGRLPSEAELEQISGIKKKRIKKIERKKLMSEWLSLSKEYDGVELIDLLSAPEESAIKSLNKQAAIKLLAEKIDLLSERERLILSLYYYEELTQAEIAEILELSTARISQIHSKTIRRLRGMLSRSKEYF